MKDKSLEAATAACVKTTETDSLMESRYRGPVRSTKLAVHLRLLPGRTGGGV